MRRQGGRERWGARYVRGAPGAHDGARAREKGAGRPEEWRHGGEEEGGQEGGKAPAGRLEPGADHRGLKDVKSPQRLLPQGGRLLWAKDGCAGSGPKRRG